MLRHLEPVVKHLQMARTKLQNPKVTLADRERAAAAVEALVDCIRQSFNKKLLSASSKLLNMLGVELPLFDSLARTGSEAARQRLLQRLPRRVGGELHAAARELPRGAGVARRGGEGRSNRANGRRVVMRARARHPSHEAGRGEINCG